MNYQVLLLVGMVAGSAAWAEPIIWNCEDVQRTQEFSSIQCGPDARIYIPPNTNAGQLGGDLNQDRRYIEFLNRHRITNPDGVVTAPPAPAQPAPEPPKSSPSEGRNLEHLKQYRLAR